MAKEIIRPSQFSKSISQEKNNNDVVLSAEQNSEINALYENFFSEYKLGKVVKGRITSISNDGIHVDINYKAESIIPKYEFSAHELKSLKVDSEIEAILDELESAEGTVVLSYEKAKALKAWDIIHKLFEEDKPVEGLVTHKVKGGLSVDIGIPAFLPGSQVDVQRVANFDQYVGQTITANIIKINKKRGNVIISRRKHLTDQRAGARKQILDTLSEHAIIQGIVKNITNYGAFIDIGGVDGLLHITDMTWGRISHPSEIIKIGETITVKILSFDKENEKISLGMKQLASNPWEKLDSSIKISSIIKGRVSSITDYGLFVEIQKGVEGLVHISEISWVDRINDLKKHYSVNDEIEALVISLDKDIRRMSLSIKQRDKNPWETIEQEFSVGQRIKGSISNITDFGIFVQLKPGIDGLVHISDLSWTEHIEHPASIYNKGQDVEAQILAIDIDNKKISLGIKQLQQDPWSVFEQNRKVGDIIEGEITKITNFGIFVKLDEGIEGLVHVSEVSKTDQRMEDMFKPTTKHQFRIVKISKEEHKVALTPKLIIEKEEKKPQVKVAKEREEVFVQEQVKTKNPLQLELEKHSARVLDNEDKGN